AKRKNWDGSLAWGSSMLGACAAPTVHQKGIIFEAQGGHAGSRSIIGEDEDASSDLRRCILSAYPPQASHGPAQDPGTGKAGIMMDGDTKKDVHTTMEIHYTSSTP